MEKSFVLTLLMLLIISMPIFAHVVLYPTQTIIGEQVYEVRMPNERDNSSVVSLRLVVPDGVIISAIRPEQGWNYTELTVPTPPGTKMGDDPAPPTLIKQITWFGGNLNPGEYMSFFISTYYQSDTLPTTLSWKAYQTYSDGEVVSWDGTVDGQPAPTVTITNVPEIDSVINSVNDLRNSTAAFQTEEQAGIKQLQAQEKADANNLSTLFWISGTALILSVVSVILSLKGRKIS